MLNSSLTLFCLKGYHHSMLFSSLFTSNSTVYYPANYGLSHKFKLSSKSLNLNNVQGSFCRGRVVGLDLIAIKYLFALCFRFFNNNWQIC